jgi:hypothetical protein
VICLLIDALDACASQAERVQASRALLTSVDGTLLLKQQQQRDSNTIGGVAASWAAATG